MRDNSTDTYCHMNNTSSYMSMWYNLNNITCLNCLCLNIVTPKEDRSRELSKAVELFQFLSSCFFLFASEYMTKIQLSIKLLLFWGISEKLIIFMK